MIEEQQLIPYHTSPLPTGKNWLVFAPHADDETFGMGGTLLLAKQESIHTSLVVMTNGELGIADQEMLQVTATRRKEAQQAADLLAFETVIFLGEKDRELSVNEQTLKKITEIIQQQQPDCIFIPAPLEFHPDHRASTQIVWQALHKMSYQGSLYGYEISAQGPVNTLIDITSVAAGKLEVMQVYQSQLQENNYISVVQALDTARTYTLAQQVNCAEGFLKLTTTDNYSPAEQANHLLALYFPAEVQERTILNTDRLHELEQKITHLENIQQQFLQTTSWKITRPLRSLKEINREKIKPVLNHRYLIKTLDHLKRGEIKVLLSKSTFVLKHRLKAFYKPEVKPFTSKLEYFDNDRNSHKTIEKTNTVAVICHLYYFSLWPEIKSSLENIPVAFDLFINVNSELDFKHILEIEASFPNVYISSYENRGRDVLPFIKTFKRIRSQNYQYICKIHSKKSFHREDGDRWRNHLILSLIGTKERINEIFQLFENEKQLGLVAPRANLMSYQEWPGLNDDALNDFTKKINLTLPKDFIFPAGSMFWFRPQALLPLLDTLNNHTFEEEEGQIDGTLAHAVERMVGLSVLSQQMSMTEV